MARMEFYTERRGIVKRRLQYRWRVRATNGRILSVSSEGYNNLAEMRKAVQFTHDAMTDALGRTIPIMDR